MPATCARQGASEASPRTRPGNDDEVNGLYSTTLMRTGADSEIELAMTVTPLGAISRLKHALDDFEGERERYRQRLADARRRLASYQSRDDSAEFAFAGELADKRRQLAEVEAALATDIEGAGATDAIAA